MSGQNECPIRDQVKGLIKEYKLDKVALIKAGITGLKKKDPEVLKRNAILADLEWAVGEIERLRDEIKRGI